MGSIFALANGAIFLTFVFSPVFVAFGLAAATWKTSLSFRTPALRSLAAGLLLGVTDWALFAALPRFNLSFGPLALPLTAWWGMRYLLFMVWAGVSRALSAKQKNLQPLTAAYFSASLLLTALLLYSFYDEPFNLGVTRLEHTVSTQGFQPVRIAHLTDLHLARITRLEKELLLRLNEEQPDLILLTGDYLNLSNLNDPVALQQARQVLADLHAPLGVFAVGGTVDSPAHMQALFDGLDITILDNETHEIQLSDGSLYLVGVSNVHTDQDAAQLNALMANIPQKEFSILLYHTPDLIETAAQTSIDLYFAGHTHGGQVRLPFYGALITLSRYGKRFEMGDYQVNGTRLYVSRGIGMEGSIAPRLRFLCPPEFVILDLKGNQ